MLTVIVVLAWVPIFAACLAGYLGVLHPAGDSFAVFRMELAGVLLGLSVLSFFLGAPWLGAVGGLLSVIALVPLLLAMRTVEPGDGLVLYQKNLLFRNDTPAEVVEDILAVAPDIVTLQEVSARNEIVPEALLETLPHQAICPFDTVGAVAVLSQWPIEEVRCDPQAFRGLVAARVATPAGPVWMVSVHLHWPWPMGQAAQVDRMLPVIADLDGPVVMAGDFNMVRWSATVRRMVRAMGGTPLGPSIVTRTGNNMALRIDHVVAPTGAIGAIERRGLQGSDHYGVVARIGLDR